MALWKTKISPTGRDIIFDETKTIADFKEKEMSTRIHSLIEEENDQFFEIRTPHEN